NVKLVVNDQYATMPAPLSQALISGERVFTGFTPSISTGSLVVSAVDDSGSGSPLTTQSTSVVVNRGLPSKLIVVMPVESLDPGRNVAPFGVSGTPSTRTAGVLFNAGVYATDSRYNWVPTVSQNPIRVTSGPPSGFVGDFAMTNGSATITNLNLITAGFMTLSAVDMDAAAPVLDPSGPKTFPLAADTPFGLRILLPNETRVSERPRVTTTGRTGPAFNTQAGPTFAFDVVVDINDVYWNLTPGTSQEIRLTSDDPFAVITPPTQVITTSGTYTVYMKRAGTARLVAQTVSPTLVAPWNYTLESDTSSVITVSAGLPTRLVLKLPGENFSEGSPTGKSLVAVPQKAGDALTAGGAGVIPDVRVAVVDDFNNIVKNCGANPKCVAEVKIGTPRDPYAPSVSTVAINTVDGFTPAITVVLRKATTDQYLTAEEYNHTTGLADDNPATVSTFTVVAAEPVGLQLLMPGQIAAPGSGAYLTGPPYGGFTGAISTPTAGSTFTITVNMVDRFMNMTPPVCAPGCPIVSLTSNDPYASNGLTGALGANGTIGIANFKLLTKSTLTIVTGALTVADPICQDHPPT
ncbi:MAG: hypothetical protein AAB131_16120, partial [Actinomycetota bacterium]